MSDLIEKFRLEFNAIIKLDEHLEYEAVIFLDEEAASFFMIKFS